MTNSKTHELTFSINFMRDYESSILFRRGNVLRPNVSNLAIHIVYAELHYVFLCSAFVLWRRT